MSDLIGRLAADLEQYRGKAVGSLRIDMGEVQKILAARDAIKAQQAEIARLREVLSMARRGLAADDVEPLEAMSILIMVDAELGQKP